MNIEEAATKYQNDADFKALVDVMVYNIHKLNFTPGEMKQAAVYACIRFEQMRIRPMVVENEDD